jgi:hypothetical protein
MAGSAARKFFNLSTSLCASAEAKSGQQSTDVAERDIHSRSQRRSPVRTRRKNREVPPIDAS